MSEEEWRDIPGWEHLYQVSDLGRVRSLKREVAGGNGSRAIRGGRVLKPSPTYAYLHVTLSRDNVRSNHRVHVLVMTTFGGSRRAGMHACHRDGNASNNRADNLYWGTPMENQRDKARHGTDRRALKRGYCAQGHPWTEANTYFSKRNGTPTCRTCRREGMRRGKQAA